LWEGLLLFFLQSLFIGTVIIVDRREEHSQMVLGPCDIERHYDNKVLDVKQNHYEHRMIFSTCYTGHACYSLFKSVIYSKVTCHFLLSIFNYRKWF